MTLRNLVMQSQNLRNTKHTTYGFTMLEILVAIVILSFGLLGLAGLQANGLKNNNSAYLRTQANLLAYDMIDRMRANQQGVINGDYDLILDSVPIEIDCLKNECTISQMATHDTNQWVKNLKELLPSGRGKVVGNGQGSIFTITIMWDEHRTGATGTNCNGDPKVDLTCFRLSTKIS